MNQRLLAHAIALNTGACSGTTVPEAGPPAQTLAEFESQLDRLRADLAIPGMSAIVMLRDSIVWEGSLGVADVTSQRRVKYVKEHLPAGPRANAPAGAAIP